MPLNEYYFTQTETHLYFLFLRLKLCISMWVTAFLHNAQETFPCHSNCLWLLLKIKWNTLLFRIEGFILEEYKKGKHASGIMIAAKVVPQRNLLHCHLPKYLVCVCVSKDKITEFKYCLWSWEWSIYLGILLAMSPRAGCLISLVAFPRMQENVVSFPGKWGK